MRSMRNGFRTQPAPLVRGSSRRIMSLRFRPAYISVINRRASSWAVIGPAVHAESSRLTNRNVIPPQPPIETEVGTRTVLSGKGSLRRAEHRRALACCAPFRPDHSTMGGSGGNTSRSYWASYKTERLKNTARASMGVDRSLHIRSLSEASRRTTVEEQDEARAGALRIES